MAAGVDAVQTGNPWVFTFNGSTAAHTLPYTFWFDDLIPMRLRWLPEAGAAATSVIIKDGQGNQVYEEWCAAANADPSEQRPRGKEKWLAVSSTSLHTGLSITTFGSGVLYLYF